MTSTFALLSGFRDKLLGLFVFQPLLSDFKLLLLNKLTALCLNLINPLVNRSLDTKSMEVLEAIDSMHAH